VGLPRRTGVRHAGAGFAHSKLTLTLTLTLTLSLSLSNFQWAMMGATFNGRGL